MHIGQLKVQQLLGPSAGPRPPGLQSNVQTKANEQIISLFVSDEEKENCICQNGQNLSYWNRYFVMYPHKCTLNNFKKKYQEKWENAYLTVKNARASRTLRQVLDPSQYWLASLVQLHFTMSVKPQKKFWALLDRILDPLVGVPPGRNLGPVEVLWDGDGEGQVTSGSIIWSRFGIPRVLTYWKYYLPSFFG